MEPQRTCRRLYELRREVEELCHSINNLYVQPVSVQYSAVFVSSIEDSWGVLHHHHL